CESVEKWRAERDQGSCDKALEALREAAGTDVNLMAATLDCARAGVTTGEWAGVLREVFGEYRAPTGVAAASGGGEADETLDDVPVVVGGIIPDSDARRLREQGVARVFTPKDFGMTDIMGQVVDVVREANGLADKVATPA